MGTVIFEVGHPVDQLTGFPDQDIYRLVECVSVRDKRERVEVIRDRKNGMVVKAVLIPHAMLMPSNISKLRQEISEQFFQGRTVIIP